jgi:hypothetical protein
VLSSYVAIFLVLKALLQAALPFVLFALVSFPCHANPSSMIFFAFSSVDQMDLNADDAALEP